MWVLVALGWPPLGQRRLSFQSAKPKGMPQNCRLLSGWAVFCGITVEKLIFHLQCAEGCQGPYQACPACSWQCSWGRSCWGRAGQGLETSLLASLGAGVRFSSFKQVIISSQEQNHNLKDARKERNRRAPRISHRGAVRKCYRPTELLRWCRVQRETSISWEGRGVAAPACPPAGWVPC